MGVEALSDRQIADVVRRYREKNLIDGGPYSLAELLLEQRRRLKTDVPTVALARKIVELARAAPDGLTTYKELWDAFHPGRAWIGNKSQQIMGNALARVVEYCVRRDLPILTVLVVQSGTRRLDPKAIANIYDDARELGVVTGTDMHAFVDEQRDRARAVLTAYLPEDETAAA